MFPRNYNTRGRQSKGRTPRSGFKRTTYGSVCKEAQSGTKFAYTSILYILILFSVLSLFFYFIVSKTTTQVVNGELKKAVRNNTQNLLKKLGNKGCDEVKASKEFIDGIERLYEKPSKIVQETNTWLYITVAIIGLAIAAFLGGSYLFLRFSCGMCSFMGPIIIETLIIFAFIAVAEYSFFRFIAVKFVPLPPSEMVTSFIKHLKKSA